MLRFLTSGESHGKCLMGILEGMPSGVSIDELFINRELVRRQGGYGRGGRQQIEADAVDITGGIYQGKTTGAPIGMVIKNKDFKINEMPALTRPRPGHADLVGSIKYDQGIRPVLERASARSTAMRVAIGAVAKLLLRECGIAVASHVVRVGEVALGETKYVFDDIAKKNPASKLNCIDPQVEKQMIAAIDAAQEKGDTLGGIIEVIASGVPMGIGSFVSCDRKLDGRIAQGLMSIQAIKAVAFGMGCAVAGHFGSDVHDPIVYDATKGYSHTTNNAGGIEGGMSNGEDIVVRCAMKPIATLKTPLQSVDMVTKTKTEASFERSDVCAITACGVIAEAVLAYEIAAGMLEKFGSDSLGELKNAITAYTRQCAQQ